VQDYAFNQVMFEYDGLEEAFPPIDPGVRPFGSRVLVQIRMPKRKTKGGIILDDSTRDTETWNTQVAKVRAIGELAFRNRSTQDPWPEGSWVSEGDFVRVPKYGGDRWSVKTDEGEVIFVLFNDLDLLGAITGDPLVIKAFI